MTSIPWYASSDVHPSVQDEMFHHGKRHMTPPPAPADTPTPDPFQHKRFKWSLPTPSPTIISEDPFANAYPSPLSTASACAVDEDLDADLEYESLSDVYNQQQSPFFRLPAELRNVIYTLALPNSTLEQMQIPASRHTPHHSLLGATFQTNHSQISAAEPPLLRTCRRARAEGHALWLHNNDFLVRRRDSVNFHPRPKTNASACHPSYDRHGNLVPRWLDTMPETMLSHIRNVVLCQISRGVYKSEGEWRRDASACFRLRYVERSTGHGWVVEYVMIDRSGRSEKYAERLKMALEQRMEELAKLRNGMWTRQDIWDLAYLL